MESIDWKLHFEDFVESTSEERRRAEKRRDYRDLKQWTDEEVSKLSQRQQAAIVFDHFSKKIDAVTGLEVERRTDPKAYPVSPKYEKAAEAITDALRYVESSVMLDDTLTEVFEDKIVEGYGGAIVEYDSKKKAIDVVRIPWDRIYFDPFSRRKDFSDAKYMGITLWMDIEDAVAIYPDKEDELRNIISGTELAGDTFEDRPSDWVNISRKRVRINQEYYETKKGWVEVVYSGDTIIKDPAPSQYLDCDGVPCNPIEIQCDYIDRENNRWGWSERLIDPQDEINHRHSKALFMLSSKSVIAERGAFGDTPPEVILNELRKGMSFIEYTPLGGNPPTIDSQQELGTAQLQFYQEAKASMDAVGINPELTGRTEGAISGRAFIARQQGGAVELMRVFARHSEFKVRIYRQIWARIKQFWTEKKWIRVTDIEGAMKFIGLNVPVTKIEFMLEQQSGMDIDKLREKSGGAVDELIQQAIARDPVLGQVVEVRNNVTELDMDIVIEEAPDTFVQRQEQFDTLAQLAVSRTDPEMFKALVKLSGMPNKDDVLEMFEREPTQEEVQQQQQAAQVQMMQLQADIQEKQSKINKTNAEVEKILSEIPLNEAKAKDELASAVERVGKTSVMPI